MMVGSFPGRWLALLVVLSLALPMSPVGSADTKTVFSGGLPSMSIVFPLGGGYNTSTGVDLPSDEVVSAAVLDVEGRPLAFDSLEGMIDFNAPNGSTAWIGMTGTVPPDQAPANYESIDGTADPGLDATNDNQYLSATVNNAAAYNMFEFDVSGLSLDNFSLYWKGMGTTQANMGQSGSTANLYMWNAATQQWENYYAFAHPSLIVMDKEVYFNMSSNASDYIDKRDDITMLATVSDANLQTTTMDTDYVSLGYSGKGAIYPQNLTLDVGGDGSVEWHNDGALKSKVSISGADLVAGFQRALDAAAAGQVHVPLGFGCKSAGVLFISNLTVVFAPRNQPPAASSIPDIHITEVSNGTGLLDLWQYFSDDVGVANLTFSMVYQQDPTKVLARLNADGHHVDFSLPTRYWFGEESFRVRARDGQGLWVESNIFTVHVAFVDHPPVLEPFGDLMAAFGVPFQWTFRATDPDTAFDPNESLTFSLNSTLLALVGATGIASFTPQKRDVGVHPMAVIVMDHYGLVSLRDFTLTVGNVNSPPSITTRNDTFMIMEDSAFTYQFLASDPDLEIGLDNLSWSADNRLLNLSAGGLANWTPDDRDVGVHRFRVTVTDSGGLSDSLNITVTVLEHEEPPILAPVQNMTVDEDTNVSFSINASDEDIGDVLTFTTDSDFIKIDRTGLVSFRADDKDVGVHVINVTVTDRSNLTATVSFIITVRPVEEPPTGAVITAPLNGTRFKQGATISFEGNASDEDGDVLNFTWFSDGNLLGQGIRFSTGALKPGAHIITLSASDGTYTNTSAPVVIIVTKKPAPSSKGFIPGFEGMMVLGAAGMLLLSWRRTRTRPPLNPEPRLVPEP